MSRSVAPTLEELLDAYALLEAEHTASSGDLRRAYRRLARTHHPDRVPPNSPEHRQATTRMAAINAAYDLIRDAPLRHHPMSRPSDPDLRYTQAHVDEALRRARDVRWVDAVVGGVAFSVLCLLALLTLVPVLSRAGVSYPMILVIVGITVATVWFGRRWVDFFVALDGVVALLRLLQMR